MSDGHPPAIPQATRERVKFVARAREYILPNLYQHTHASNEAISFQ
jgi:hypothetical protein